MSPDWLLGGLVHPDFTEHQKNFKTIGRDVKLYLIPGLRALPRGIRGVGCVHTFNCTLHTGYLLYTHCTAHCARYSFCIHTALYTTHCTGIVHTLHWTLWRYCTPCLQRGCVPCWKYGMWCWQEVEGFTLYQTDLHTLVMSASYIHIKCVYCPVQ